MGKTHQYDGYIGYIRIDGKDVEAGLVDFLSMKNTVEGTEKVLTHFLKRQNSELADLDSINFPVRVREGCWELLIPVAVFLVGRPLSSYLNEMAKVLAKNDAKDSTSREMFAKALQSAQNVIRIAKHLGTMANRRDLDAKVIDRDTIIIRNSQGQELRVTKPQLEEYQSAPKELFSTLSYAAGEQRTVHVGYIDNTKPVDQSIGGEDRSIFQPGDEDKEIVLPELVHGKYVEIEGRVTRGNEKSNNIGFEYGGHIITCEPVGKYITSYLQAHYKICRMSGIVSRIGEKGEVLLKPRVHFTGLEVISSTPQQDLFS